MPSSGLSNSHKGTDEMPESRTARRSSGRDPLLNSTNTLECLLVWWTDEPGWWLQVFRNWVVLMHRINVTGEGGHYSLEGTIFTCAFCPARHFSLVNSVRDGHFSRWGTFHSDNGTGKKRNERSGKRLSVEQQRGVKGLLQSLPREKGSLCVFQCYSSHFQLLRNVNK